MTQSKTRKAAASKSEAEQQREEEAKATAEAAEKRDAEAIAPDTDEKPPEPDVKDVQAEAKADAEARQGGPADDSEEGDGGVLRPKDTSGNSDVQQQRDDEAKAAEERAAEAAGRVEMSKRDALLAAAAPGGQRTALAKSKEGSTTVSQTAASPRPASGPLDAPVAGVENLAASDDDPDNRVYADEAGPRDVFEDTEATKAKYVDADGNEVDADAIFEDDGKTFVTTKMRVYEVFTFPNTEVEGKRLAYAAGRRVPRGEAENVKRQISPNAQIA